MNNRGNLQFNRVAVTAFVICSLLGSVLSLIAKGPAPMLIGFLIGLYLLNAIKVVRQRPAREMPSDDLLREILNGLRAL